MFTSGAKAVGKLRMSRQEHAVSCDQAAAHNQTNLNDLTASCNQNQTDLNDPTTSHDLTSLCNQTTGGAGRVNWEELDPRGCVAIGQVELRTYDVVPDTVQSVWDHVCPGVSLGGLVYPGVCWGVGVLCTRVCLSWGVLCAQVCYCCGGPVCPGVPLLWGSCVPLLWGSCVPRCATVVGVLCAQVCHCCGGHVCPYCEGVCVGVCVESCVPRGSLLCGVTCVSPSGVPCRCC